MSDLRIKPNTDNGDLSKKYSKKELKKMSKIFRPLEKILNEHYAEHTKGQRSGK